MMTVQQTAGLSNVQQEILKLYATENNLYELKPVITPQKPFKPPILFFMKKDKTMQITINLDDDLIKTAFELSGIKSIQELCEQALKVLIENYQAALIYSNEQAKDTMSNSHVNEDIND